MNIHYLHPQLLQRAVRGLLVGAGGTGSRVLEGLVNLHRAMLALGHPEGLHVTVVDDDTVSAANIGRQAFYPCDIGRPKAHVLVNRANMALNGLGTWSALQERVDTASVLRFDLVIGAVDTRRARLGILRGLEAATPHEPRYWLDLGNRADDGQVVLGEVTSSRRKTDQLLRLPHAAELFPELIDVALDDVDDTPSCSLAQALVKQSLFINGAIAQQGLNLLWMLFTAGQLTVHGAFVNLKTVTVAPLRVDAALWERMGVRRDKRRRKIQQPSRAAA